MLASVFGSAPLNRDFGLLILRLGIGLSMVIFHGWAKISGGKEMWTGVGENLADLSITFAPTLWGFLASFAEFGGSVLLILGILFRPAASMLAFTMLVAVLVHLNMPAEIPGSGWEGASHALELLAVYVALLLMGPGRYNLQSLLGSDDASDGQS